VSGREDEQRVRTMAGWIGVEISKSRVRTPGKAGFGLYRVRGSRPIQRALAVLGPDMKSRELTEWTPYVFTLSGIEMAVRQAIRWGTHAGPNPLKLAYGPMPGATCVDVPTRWTSAYRGRRDLGLTADLEELERTDPAVGAASARLDETVREIVTRSTVRSRQRAANNEFQAEHLRRRAYGLQQRHQRKLGNSNGGNS
jgi:hypothetical protein